VSIDIQVLQRALQIAAGQQRAGQWDFNPVGPDLPAEGPYVHGPGGLFGVRGVERDVIATYVRPRGLASMIPARPDVTMWPEFAYITGFTEGDDEIDDSQGVCDDGPSVGEVLGCITSAQFGRLSAKTKTLDIVRAIQQINRGEFFDLSLVNTAQTQPLNVISPNGVGLDTGALLELEMMARMGMVGRYFQNKLIRLFYTGTPLNNNLGGGYREFPGIDTMVATGHQDVHTHDACPSLDSLIKDMEYLEIDSSNGETYVYRLLDMYRFIKQRADREGFMPVNWVLTMRKGAFDRLLDIYVCTYAFSRCAVNTENGNVVQLNTGDALRMTEEMRTGKFLWLDGDRVPVVIDDGIPEKTHATNSGDLDEGQFASNIYLLPMQVMGNYDVLYWQFMDYQRAISVGQSAGYAQGEFATDDGRFMWFKRYPRLQCIQLDAVVEPRVLLRTPQLAFKMTNVMYVPNGSYHEESALPGDVDYPSGSGVSGRDAASGLEDIWGTVS